MWQDYVPIGLGIWAATSFAIAFVSQGQAEWRYYVLAGLGPLLGTLLLALSGCLGRVI